MCVLSMLYSTCICRLRRKLAEKMWDMIKYTVFTSLNTSEIEKNHVIND